MISIKKFTDKFISNIKPTDERLEYSEANGFILRVTSTGIKSWVYSFSFNRKAKRLTLGRYPSISLADARVLHAEARALRDRGIDPVQAKKDVDEQQKLALKKETQTVEWLANDFYLKNVIKNRKAPEEAKRIIEHDVIPLLGELKLEDVTTKKITLALEKIVDRGAPVQANRTMNIIKQMFKYGLSKGDIDTDPAKGINAINIGGMEVPKDRHLSYEEIKKVWGWLDSENITLHPSTALALKVLLLTGVRSGELRLATWQEFNFDDSLWTIPPEHQKSKKGRKPAPHKIHLTSFIKTQLKQLKELSGCDHVLPAKTGDKPLTDKVLSRSVARNYEAMGVEKWTPHDLRRTMNTELSGLGVEPYIVEKCLGHRLQGMMGVYNQQEYLPERKAALELWSDTIKKLVTNKNVIPFENRLTK